MRDHISRQAAIEALLEKGQKSRRYKIGEIWELNFDEIREALATVSSAEPKKGKWVKADRQQYFRKHYPASQCSICGWRKNYSGKYNYCPNCGADMRGE